MAHDAELMKAIGTHGQWKMKLRTAIGTGKLDSPIEVIRSDNACEFGKWMGAFKATDASDAEVVPRIRKLHAEFHTVAGRIAELAAQGKQKEAEDALSDGGSFAKASALLTDAIMEWKRR